MRQRNLLRTKLVIYFTFFFQSRFSKSCLHFSVKYSQVFMQSSLCAVAPICYAHLAATQLGMFMKFEDKSETSSSHGGLTSAGAVPVPQLPKLQDNVCNSMFFCWGPWPLLPLCLQRPNAVYTKSMIKASIYSFQDIF